MYIYIYVYTYIYIYIFLGHVEGEVLDVHGGGELLGVSDLGINMGIWL